MSAERPPWIENGAPPSPCVPPTSCVVAVPTAPGRSEAYAPLRRVVGTASSVLRAIVCCWMTFCVSTTGAAPETVTVSSSVPTFSSAFTVVVNAVVNSRSSRLTVLKPGKLNVTT